MKYEEVAKLTDQNIERFKKIEARKWGAEGGVIELAKQVGELSALIMTREKYYFPNREKDDAKYSASNERIADELADIMFVLTRIAQHYDINLIEACALARKSEDEYLKSKGV